MFFLHLGVDIPCKPTYFPVILLEFLAQYNGGVIFKAKTYRNRNSLLSEAFLDLYLLTYISDIISQTHSEQPKRCEARCHIISRTNNRNRIHCLILPPNLTRKVVNTIVILSVLNKQQQNTHLPVTVTASMHCALVELNSRVTILCYKGYRCHATYDSFLVSDQQKSKVILLYRHSTTPWSYWRQQT